MEKSLKNSLNKSSSSHVDFDEAVRILSEGRVCAFPTDTVFGVGARADDRAAVNALYKLKHRAPSKPFIVLCADLEMVRQIVEFSIPSEKLAGLWPGALTLVMPQVQPSNIVREVNAGLDNLGVRIPDCPDIQQLIKVVGVPIATSSANISGSETGSDDLSPSHQFSRKVPVLKNRNFPQNAPLGRESTILQVEDAQVKLLRQGALSIKEILQTTGIIPT